MLPFVLVGAPVPLREKCASGARYVFLLAPYPPVKEFLTFPNILCHPETIERWRSHVMRTFLLTGFGFD